MTTPYHDVPTMSMGEINRELDNLTSDDPAAREHQAELFDALMSGDMGAAPARRAMCERKRTDDSQPK